jgi:hypothetical protein
MPTISEDLFESQCTTTMHKTRNNEDLREVTDLKANTNPIMDFSDISNIKDQSKTTQNSLTQNYSYVNKPKSKSKHRKTPIKTIDPFSMKSKSKKPIRRDYSKLIEDLQNNCNNPKMVYKKSKSKLKLSTGHEISIKKPASKSLKRTIKRPSTAVNKTNKQFLMSSFSNSKGITYTAENCQSTYIKQTSQRRLSYHALLKKYKKRHNSVNPTFKPTINPHSKWVLDEKSYNSLERTLKGHNGVNYSSFSCRNSQPLAMGDLSTSQERLMDRSKEEYIKMKQRVFKYDYTFKPKINQQSKKLATSKRSKSASSVSQDKTSNNGIYDRLYQDSIEHAKVMQILTQKVKNKACTFRPDLSGSSSSQLKTSKDYTKHHKNVPKGLDKARKSCFSTRNLLTQNKLKSKSRSNTRSNGRSVHESLYADSKLRNIKNQTGTKIFYQERKKKFSKYLSKQNKQDYSQQTKQKRSRSRLIMEKIKSQRCRELFNKLDDDNDGYISAQKIDILHVDNYIIDLITPFLLDIESKALILNFEQFLEALTKFSKKNLTLDEKNALFGPKKTFEPQCKLKTR